MNKDHLESPLFLQAPKRVFKDHPSGPHQDQCLVPLVIFSFYFQTSPRTYPGVYVRAQAFPILEKCEKLSFLLLHTIPPHSFIGAAR